MANSDPHPKMTSTDPGDLAFNRGDEPTRSAFEEKRPARAATHHAERVGEIVVAAPHGVRRVPFSVGLAADGALLVLSFLPDESVSLERFDREGRYLGQVARFRAGNGPGEIRSPAGIALDDSLAILIVREKSLSFHFIFL